MSLPASASNLPSPWQDRLLGKPKTNLFKNPGREFRILRTHSADRVQDHCRRTKLAAPIFNIVSDRRGTVPDSLCFFPLPPSFHLENPTIPALFVYRFVCRGFIPYVVLDHCVGIAGVELRRTARTPTFSSESLTADANRPCVGITGGRTAWSSTVLVQGRSIAARYWYDGQYINNAKEDAAEVALLQLQNQTRVPTVYQGQVWRQDHGSSSGA